MRQVRGQSAASARPPWNKVRRIAMPAAITAPPTHKRCKAPGRSARFQAINGPSGTARKKA
ncbi:MAG: hypothetical protein MZV70_45560 [Desulfobacterales bacterium]|nr:hypothetical protein [Desulfobacterales bacterium]